MRKGVFVDQTTDIGRMENVHIHGVYWWRVSEPYKLDRKQTFTLF